MIPDQTPFAGRCVLLEGLRKLWHVFDRQRAKCFLRNCDAARKTSRTRNLQGSSTLPGRTVVEPLFALLEQEKLVVRWQEESLNLSHASLCICLQTALLQEDEPAGWDILLVPKARAELVVIASRHVPTSWVLAGAEDQVQRKWHKQLLSVLSWLLPEHRADGHVPQATQQPSASSNNTSSAHHKHDISGHSAVKPDDTMPGPADASISIKQDSDALVHQADSAGNAEPPAAFDAAELYAAVKPQGTEPELSRSSTKLRPTLRPYQKRAAAWMVSREQQTQVRSQCSSGAMPAEPAV